MYQYAKSELNRVLKVCDDYLSKRTFFIGDSLTIFDVCLCIQLDVVFRLLITEELRKSYKSLTRWFTYVRCLPPIMSKIGKMVLCRENAIEIDFPE